MGFLDLFRRTETRSATVEWASPWDMTSVTFGGNNYPIGAATPTLSASRPQITGDIAGLVNAAAPNTTVGAAVLARALVLSQLWFRFRDNETLNLFGSSGLAPLETRSGPSAMPRLLMQAEQHASYAGNAFFRLHRSTGLVRLMRPDWVQIVLHARNEPDPALVEAAQHLPVDEQSEALAHLLDAEILGYLYDPPVGEPQVLFPEDVAHWIPEPHPLTPWMGGSWVASVVRELAADAQADRHSDKFFAHGATPRLVYKMDPSQSPQQVTAFKKINEELTAGVENAHRSLYLGGATDVVQVGSKLADLALKEFRGTLESRIATRSRVPAVVLGISEGMQGSSLNAGNYGQTRRLWADGWFTPTADGLAAALQNIVDVPAKSHLSWDPERVLFLQEDQMDAAEIFGKRARACRALTDGGFDPDTVIAAAKHLDVGLLAHTGLLPVQVQPPGTGTGNDNQS